MKRPTRRTAPTILVGAIAFAHLGLAAPLARGQESPPGGSPSQPEKTDPRKQDPAPQPVPSPDPAPTPPTPVTPTPAPAEPPVPAPAEPPVAPLPTPRVPAAGSEVVIYLTEGNRVMGILVSEAPDTLVVRIAGIETTFKSNMIVRYEVLPPILERYREMRATIGDDPDGLAMLIEWLRSREQLELALKEADRLLTLEPNHAEGRRLKQIIESQIELKKKAKGVANPVPVKPAGNDEPLRDEGPPFPLLTEAQINTLKVFEIDLDDPPRLTIKRDTITKLIARYADSPHMPTTQEGRDALYRRTPTAILDLMFKLRARDLYPDVVVTDQPKAMRVFRDDVHAGWLVNSCATTQCHGGEEAGRLMLFPNRPRSDASVYTNFLILDRYRLDDGTALINYEDPGRSPLLHLGMSRRSSAYPHPEVPRGHSGRDAWKAIIDDSTDRAFQKTVAWMKLMYRPRPEYPIEYQPPKPSVLPKKDPTKAPPR